MAKQKRGSSKAGQKLEGRIEDALEQTEKGQNARQKLYTASGEEEELARDLWFLWVEGALWEQVILEVAALEERWREKMADRIINRVIGTEGMYSPYCGLAHLVLDKKYEFRTWIVNTKSLVGSPEQLMLEEVGTYWEEYLDRRVPKAELVG